MKELKEVLIRPDQVVALYLVESGEGIERFPSGPASNSSMGSSWNPVKELKDLVAFRDTPAAIGYRGIR